MAVKLELYRVFKEVAETGNISVAAKNLYISQSAVVNRSSSWKTPCRPVFLPAVPGASP